ncbi:FAD-binding oxidoreductase [Natronospirillum operosum]|uniref:FAD-binding oxidoreductase n=1 Tax=Natronospirillum operosum TaxID=2759953 RepID=A0A4Z0WBB6_9GAMM|nr:FAD-binding oxidoreductase [Natronospirillum operosum]TGG91446.1 FAD-binding oxidoreductase [Natronospirillum operosum]
MVALLNPQTHSEAHAPSYYVATAHEIPQNPTLSGPVQARVCVVGGGFSGVNTALELAERGFDVVLLEARRIGWGASGRNGGQLLRGIGHGTTQFRKVIGDEGVAAIDAMGFESVELVRARIARYDIDCDLRMGYCDLANKPAHMRAFAEEKAWLEEQGYPHHVELVPSERLHEVVGSSRYCGGMIDMGCGHLHPLNLLLGEARAAAELGVRLFEQSPVERVERQPDGGYRVHTPGGSVQADTLVLCGNAYVQGLHPVLEGKVLPAGSYVVTTEPLPDDVAQRLLPGGHAVCDQRIDLDYYRLTPDNRLLFGGLCTYSGRDPKDIRAALRPNIKRVFPELADVKLDYAWGGMIGIGANRMPQVGRLPDGIYHAQAYSGHGLNATHMAARVLAEAISQESRRIDIFNRIPHITFPGGRRFRSPLLALGMLYHRLKDLL